MAGSTKVPDEPESGCENVKQKVAVNEIWVDVKDCKAKSLFDKFVHMVWGETGSGSCVYRPLPPQIGDGECVDLFRVFVTVRQRGGCKMVMECGLWNLIGESCGLGGGVGGALKLVYMKYLGVLDRWLDMIAESKRSKGDLGKLGDGTGKLLSDLEEHLESLLKIIADEKKKNSDVSVLNLLMEGDMEVLMIEKEKKTPMNKEEDVDTVDCMMCSSEVMDGESGASENPDDSSLNFNAGSEFPGAQTDSNSSKTDIAKEPNDEVNNMEGAEDDDIMIQSAANNEGSLTRSQKKRKRESLLGMLNWLTETAKRTCDPETVSLPDKSKWKTYGNEVPWKQVLAARERLFFRPKFNSNADHDYWLWRPVAPSMYEERNSVRERSTRKSTNANKFQLLGGAGNSREPEYDKNGVGPHVGEKYQANLPELGSSTSESELKWLGTRIWPLEKTEKRSFFEKVPIGRGRQDSCGCSISGSVECVRFHISEKSARLKPELGSAFNNWGFDVMGENTARNWTAEEEKKFNSKVKNYNKRTELLDKLRAAFPARSSSDIVNYYFNVFVLRSRAKQNRSTPHDIHSDIEKSEPKASPRSKKVGTEKSSPSIYNKPKKQKKNT